MGKNKRYGIYPLDKQNKELESITSNEMGHSFRRVYEAKMYALSKGMPEGTFIVRRLR